MRDYTKKIESLKNQRQQSKEVYIKLQGAIEVLTSMLKEESEKGEN